MPGWELPDLDTLEPTCPFVVRRYPSIAGAFNRTVAQRYRKIVVGGIFSELQCRTRKILSRDRVS